jgi:hypothetical protein
MKATSLSMWTKLLGSLTAGALALALAGCTNTGTGTGDQSPAISTPEETAVAVEPDDETEPESEEEAEATPRETVPASGDTLTLDVSDWAKTESKYWEAADSEEDDYEAQIVYINPKSKKLSVKLPADFASQNAGAKLTLELDPNYELEDIASAETTLTGDTAVFEFPETVGASMGEPAPDKGTMAEDSDEELWTANISVMPTADDAPGYVMAYFQSDSSAKDSIDLSGLPGYQHADFTDEGHVYQAKWGQQVKVVFPTGYPAPQSSYSGIAIAAYEGEYDCSADIADAEAEGNTLSFKLPAKVEGCDGAVWGLYSLSTWHPEEGEIDAEFETYVAFE